MAFYKNILVCKRQLMQLQESLLRVGKPAAAPPRKSKFVCYRCGFYFQVEELNAHPCYRKEAKCPNCLYRFVPLSWKAPQQAHPEQQYAEHRCKVCPYCRTVTTLNQQQHNRVCQAQLVRCPDCQQHVSRQIFRDHRNKCLLCRCYKCGILVYKKQLPDHLMDCGRDRPGQASNNKIHRKQAAAPPVHYYHFRNSPQSLSPERYERKQEAAPSGVHSPVPVSIENWLRH